MTIWTYWKHLQKSRLWRSGGAFEVEGIQFIGIIGFSKISLMEDRLKIDSFDGRGYTGIIDIDGNYVVNRDRSAGIGENRQLF